MQIAKYKTVASSTLSSTLACHLPFPTSITTSVRTGDNTAPLELIQVLSQPRRHYSRQSPTHLPLSNQPTAQHAPLSLPSPPSPLQHDTTARPPLHPAMTLHRTRRIKYLRRIPPILHLQQRLMIPSTGLPLPLWLRQTRRTQIRALFRRQLPNQPQHIIHQHPLRGRPLRG